MKRTSRPLAIPPAQVCVDCATVFRVLGQERDRCDLCERRDELRRQAAPRLNGADRLGRDRRQ